ncbi:uroporphyrinogen-III C-methyltransferase [Telmatocola sphagniphila]|uniref:uroporphyrinogen-III C-methyltransferase n=1 Tax=Telmatocola sphagniphila TaxID=1123043 RepID=A0A8E6BB12_9BACT|nr:uroporphyrinogen-III C-methyltransferase [Telmatocola sphagniphila]QVL34739.1 uroporphyrinogen-III C-methyltransferase [Telmatocola sphagniphila]
MKIGKVYLVGAGPGDPDLLTLKAKRLLDQADFVLYDQLLSPEVLRLIPSSAQAQAVESLPGKHPERFHSIYQSLIEHAQAGQQVVRLKSGDPMIFGRVGEETEALRKAGIPYEIVPGVTAALAAGAYLEIPLTHRLHSSLLTIVTGHECTAKGNSSLDWDNLATNRGTLAFYMGVSRLASIADNLIAHGKSPDTPCAVIHRATWSRQRTIRAPLQAIADQVQAASLEAPAILLVGEVVGLGEIEGWFEEKPLLGQRILVTRPLPQAEELARLLRDRGAEPVICPLIEIAEPASFHALDELIHRLNSPPVAAAKPWLIFTSINGVERFAQRYRTLGYDARTFGSSRIAAIGKRTAQALGQLGLKTDIVSENDSSSEALLPLLKTAVLGSQVYLCQAEEGRELLLEELSKLTQITKVPVYSQRPIEKVDLSKLEFDVAILTSPQLARLFLQKCTPEILQKTRDGRITLAVNSQRSRAIFAEAGLPVRFQSAQPDMESVVQSLQVEKAEVNYRF